MGRVGSEQRCVANNCSTFLPYTLHHTYDLAGNLTSYDNGLGTLTLGLSFDAGGRLSSVTSSVFDATHPASLFNVLTFASTGLPKNYVLGSYTGVTRTFDNRLRPVTLTATEQ